MEGCAQNDHASGNDGTRENQGRGGQDTKLGRDDGIGKSSMVKGGDDQNQVFQKENVVNRNIQKNGCANCGLKNHTTA